MSDYIERDKIFSVWRSIPAPASLTSLAAAINQTLSADVAPVRHGRWIHPHWRNSVSAADCSECGAEAQHIEYRGVQKYYKNYPSCGACMDKEN